MKALLTILAYFSSLTNTQQNPHLCSSQKRKIEIFCSGETQIGPVDTICHYIPQRLFVSQCSFQYISSIESPHLALVSFSFTKNWQPREELFYKFRALKVLDISNNQIEDVPKNTFSNNRKLVVLDLGNNLLTKIDPEVFNNLPKLRVLSPSHNKLLSLSLESLPLNSKLKSVDLSHNLLRLADIGSGVFTHLEEIDFSYNQISVFTVSADIQLTFDKLKRLDLSHNKISGVLSRRDCSALEKNMTVDMSYNNIQRIDLRYRGRDLVNSKYLHSSSPFTTTFIVHNNSLACDCYAGLMVAARGKFEFGDFLCPDNSLLSHKQMSQLVCPVPGYKPTTLPSTSASFYSSCPQPCHCYYSISLAHLTVNCTARNITTFPSVSSLPRTQDNDSVILLLADNEIQELSEDLRDTSIVHLDLTNNKITNIDERKLPSKLRRLMLSTNRFETISDEMMQHLKKSKINFSLFSNPLTCSCERMDLYLSPLHLSEEQPQAFCFLGPVAISRHTSQRLCQNKATISVVVVMLVISICIILYVRHCAGRRISPRDFDYDVFISYSHHDAYFVENVLYPGLVNNNVKCCIHTLHWQVGPTFPFQVLSALLGWRDHLQADC